MRIFGADLIFPVSSAPVRSGYVMTDDDGTVLRTGRIADLPQEDAALLEMFPGAIVPGFVNAHCHVELSHLKGVFRKGSGMAGFIDQINALRECAGKEQRLEAISAQMDGMYRQGVSAMADISNCDESFAAKAASPMYTRTFVEVFGTDPAESAEIVASAKALAAKAGEMGLDAAPTPHSCYTMSPQLISEASEAGLVSGFLSYHSQESPQEEELMRTGTGELADNYRGRGLPTPPVTGKSALSYFISRLKTFSSLPVKGHILLVHNVVVDQESIDEALASLESPFWAVCPLSNIFIHRQLPPLDLMRRNGLCILLGTDSLSSNDVLSMVDEMNAVKENFPGIPFAEVLQWATLNGARFLGKEDVLGSFEAGKKPGVVNVRGFDVDNMCLGDAPVSVRLI